MTHSGCAELSRRYPGKRAFVTGAGSGFGLAFACELARAGWQIGISDIDGERLEAAVNTISASGGSAIPFVFDVADYAQFEQGIKDFVAKTGGIDIGINNAGVGCGGYLDQLPVETFKRVVDVNLLGVIYGCYQFVPLMKKQGSGHILNIASAAAFVCPPRMSAYSVTKAGVVALSESLRGELIDAGVKVSVLMPTYVRTNVGKDSLGPKGDVALAVRMVDESKITPEEIVLETFERMARGEFYLVMPAQSRMFWRFKRMFPDTFFHFLMKEVKRIVGSDH